MMWNKSRWLQLLLFLTALGLYVSNLYRSARESSAGSLEMKDEMVAADRTLLLVTVMNVNPVARQLTAQIGFRFYGTIAQDEVTPQADLKLLVNNVGGEQEFVFPKGKRMHRVEATFPLDGNVNRYPLDHYATTLSFLMTAPGRVSQPEEPDLVRKKPKRRRASQNKGEEIPNPLSLTVGEQALERSVPVPLFVSLLASVPDFTFSGSISRDDSSKVTEIKLDLKRPTRLMRISVVVMVLMMILAVSVLAMAIKSISATKKFDFLPLSLSLSLIFGLPALRNIQPGIPPVGVFGDNLSFTWAELFVASAAIIIMWTWLVRSRTD